MFPLVATALRIFLKEYKEELGFVFLFWSITQKGDTPFWRKCSCTLRTARGVGTQLMRAAVEKARELGCYTILATVSHQRTYLKGWYNFALGFAEKGSDLWLDLSAPEGR